jgi:predicted O-methyltransferase YrrM
LDFGAGDPSDKKSKEEMQNGKMVCSSIAKLSSIGLKNVWSQWIYLLTKEKKPKVILELGTCCGFSAITMALANSDAKIYTLEGAKEIAQIASSNIKKANCSNITQVIGRFVDTLPSLLEAIAPIDFAFIDGHHDEFATVEYFKTIKPFMSKDSVMAFDDISWSDGMKKAWAQIVLEVGVTNCEDLGKIGICYIG